MLYNEIQHVSMQSNCKLNSTSLLRRDRKNVGYPFIKILANKKKLIHQGLKKDELKKDATV